LQTYLQNLHQCSRVSRLSSQCMAKATAGGVCPRLPSFPRNRGAILCLGLSTPMSVRKLKKLRTLHSHSRNTILLLCCTSFQQVSCFLHFFSYTCSVDGHQHHQHHKTSPLMPSPSDARSFYHPLVRAFTPCPLPTHTMSLAESCAQLRRAPCPVACPTPVMSLSQSCDSRHVSCPLACPCSQPPVLSTARALNPRCPSRSCQHHPASYLYYFRY